MKQFLLLLLLTTSICSTLNVMAQKGGSDADKERFIPGAIYEARYWTDMTGRNSKVFIDTMVFFNDRAAFDYTNDRCVSCPYHSTDSIVYSLMPKLQTSERDFIIGNNFVRKMNKAIVPFRGYDRLIYKIYSSPISEKDSGTGDYSLVSSQFGVIYRYNNKGDVYMLNRIDVYKDGKAVDEIDLLPLQMELGKSKIFTGDLD